MIIARPAGWLFDPEAPTLIARLFTPADRKVVADQHQSLRVKSYGNPGAKSRKEMREGFGFTVPGSGLEKPKKL